jgi:anti-sigma regulatory factor (Ser/Thr protein kinase)
VEVCRPVSDLGSAGEIEDRIADQLQASLMPAIELDPEGLDIAATYLPATKGTRVGGDWYDVIDLGAGRTALVVGDVMGRGVRAAAVMGQLRAMTLGYSRLDLPPSEVLTLLDSMVADLDHEQIVTCAYLIFDPVASTVTYANAGHPPPLLIRSTGGVDQLSGVSPPLGTRFSPPGDQELGVDRGDLIALYTDGLVERRGHEVVESASDLARIVSELRAGGGPIDELLGILIAELVVDDPEDDVALLLAQVRSHPETMAPAAFDIVGDATAVAAARRFTNRTLMDWEVSTETADVAALLVSEMVTNSIVHGRPPAQVRLRLRAHDLVIEVRDASRHLPRRRHPDRLDESGLGLQVVELLATRWGARHEAFGKVVWAVLLLR